MKNKLFLLVFILFSLQALAVDFYEGSYNQAIEEAEKENKLLLVYFTASWCGPCKHMEKFVFPDGSVSNYINSNYIPLKLDMDIKGMREIYTKFHDIKDLSVPLFVIINSKEEVFKKRLGSMNLEEFNDFVKINDQNNVIAQAKPDSVVQLEVSAEKRRQSLPWKKFLNNSMNYSWKLGFKAGFNYSTLLSIGGLNNYGGYLPGFNGGLFVDHTNKYFLFQPGISFTSKGGKASIPSETVRVNYLEAPISFSIKLFNHSIIPGFKQDVRLNIAPYGAIALSGSHKKEDEKELFGLGDEPNELKKYDYGIKTGISFQLGALEPFFGYDFGLLNLSNNTGEQLYNRGFYLSFALIIGK